MSNGARTRLIASDRLLMYGNVSVAFGLCSSLSGLGLPRQECLYTKLKLSQSPVYLSTHVECGSGYITISQCTPMLLQPVFQRSTRLPNVHLRAFCAGDRVDYSLSFVHWHSVLGVNQQLAKGYQRTKHHLDV